LIFNGDKSILLNEEDVFSGAENKRISVMVEFEGLSVKDRKTAYLEVVADHPDLDFPAWTNDGAAEQVMSSWEREHGDLVEAAQVSDTNFFGFAGQGRLSGLFDFVLITADLRASEESQDNKTSIIGRILEKAVDRTAADTELQELSDDLAERHRDITERYFASQLEVLDPKLQENLIAGGYFPS